MTLSDKYRYIQSLGKITHDGKEYVFTRDPIKDCPVVTMSNASKCVLIETIYDLIKELK